MDSAHVIAWCEREKRARWPASAGRKSTWKSDLMERGVQARHRGGPGQTYGDASDALGTTGVRSLTTPPTSPGRGSISIVDFHVAGPVAGMQCQICLPKLVGRFSPTPLTPRSGRGYPMDERAYAAAAMF